MPRALLIPLLAIALVGAIAWVGKRPAAWRWYGPFPGESELRSSYYRRKALFALRCLALVVLAAAGMWALLSFVPDLRDSRVLLLLGVFLALFAGMAVLGAILAALTAIKAATFGPNPVLRTEWEQARLEHEAEA